MAERNRELGLRETDGAAVKAAQHLLVVHEGAAARLDWRLDGAARSERFSAGDAILNPLGLFIAPRWHTDVELLLIALDPGLVSRVADDMGRRSVELIPRIRFDDDVVRSLARQLVAEFERETPPDRVYAQSLTYSLVAHLIRHHSVAGVRPSRFRGALPPAALARVIDYARTNLAESPTLEDLAQVSGFSPSHFTAMFRRSTGLAPHQYLVEQRIERARTLLTGTHLPIAEIAALAGFADQSHLTRVLKRRLGLTPRVIRGR